MLIEARSDANVIDNDSKTPLFYALANQFVVRELVENGKTNVNSRDVYGRTPLFYSFPQSLESTQYLLDKGANLLVKDDCNLSILSFFINYCLLKKLDYSYMYDSLDIFLKQGMTKAKVFQAIVNAVFCNILSSYSMLESSCDDLTLASHYCESSKDSCGMLTEISKLMKELIHCQKVRDDADEHSSGSQLRRIVGALIGLSDEPNSSDSDGNTALHHAACLPFMDELLPHDQVMYICRQLETFGISFNVRNHQAETPLLFCMARGIHEVMTQKEKCRWPRDEMFLQVCKFLLEHGSSVNETTSTGDSIFHLLLKLFQQGIGIVKSDQGIAILSEAVKLLELIVHRIGASVSTGYKTNKSSESPLHLWASLKLSLSQDYQRVIFENYTFERALKTIFDQLLECGVLLNGRNAKEETPLHLCRTWTAVTILLKAGGNVKDVDKEGRPSLLVAAKNSKFDQSSTCFYPDITVEPKVFWISALQSGLDPWAVDKIGESVLSVLIASEAFVLADALVEVASEENYLQADTIALSLLNAICKDVSTRAHWKSLLVEKIIKSRDDIVSVQSKQDTPLHYCIRNIAKTDSDESSVHWAIAKLLLSYGADCTIPNEAGETCLDIANSHPTLSEFLKTPISIDDVPLLIPWLSVSKRYNAILAKAARRQESEHVAPFWYHKKKLASGSFGLVFAGIDERDGREVAIKRIEKLRFEGLTLVRAEERREITNLTRLADCREVVRYLSFFEDNDFCYVVLELMEGNIDEFLNSTLLVQETFTLCHDIVKGLEFLHGLDILHRDLKPANILYKTYPKLCVKIADFGLSRRIDGTSSTSVYGTNAGTRCWIAPEVLTSTKPGDQHSKATDMFACGLLLHYILTVKKHPFFPADCDHKSSVQITNDTERNLILGNMEGWSDTPCSESTHLVKQLLAREASERPTAALALAHPFFWPETKKMDLLIAVGNQTEFECPRAKRTPPLTAIETDLEANFGTIVKYVDWNYLGYVHMPAIYNEMTRRRRRYDTNSVVELVRFIRNAYGHVSEDMRPTPIRKLLLKDFVFLEYFPNLVMEVYKAVTTHGWDQTREEIQYAMNK